MIIKESDLQENDSNNILEYLEKKGLNPDYACREGFCGSCRLQILEGDVKYNQEPLAFIREKEILPCISKPINKIKIGN